MRLRGQYGRDGSATFTAKAARLSWSNEGATLHCDGAVVFSAPIAQRYALAYVFLALDGFGTVVERAPIVEIAVCSGVVRFVNGSTRFVYVRAVDHGEDFARSTNFPYDLRDAARRVWMPE